MVYQPFDFLFRVNIRIFNDKVDDESVIRRDDDLPIREEMSNKRGRSQKKNATSNSRMADKVFSLVLP